MTSPDPSVIHSSGGSDAGKNRSPRFDALSAAPPDAILGLTEAFNRDANPNKMNLTVGVYKDDDGNTPILRCVKAAERRLVEDETTKGYLPIDGHADYRDATRRLVFGDHVPADRVAVFQSPGGTGGLRVAASFVADQLAAGGRLTVHLPNPTWANHNSIFAAEGLPVSTYRYLAADRRQLDFDAMIEDLSNVAAGDAVVLHACCHNPTGVDPTPEMWTRIAQTVARTGALPILDFAYQGFGRGVEADRAAITTMLASCDEAIVCNSFSKNFGLYSERVGGVSFVAASSAAADVVRTQVKRLVRCNYSNPPRHGAAVVATILNDAELRSMWIEELDHMRTRIDGLRNHFVDTMAEIGGPDYGFLRTQTGMFSYSGLSPMQVDRLKTEHGIYIVGSGRINVAGMRQSHMRPLCEAIASFA